MSVQIRYGSDKPESLIVVQDTGGFMLVPPNYRDPTTMKDFTYETKEMLGAMRWFGEEITRDVNDPSRCVNVASVTESAMQALHALNIAVERLRRCLPKFSDRLPDHRPNIPSFAGMVGETYHDVAVKLCAERRSWLSQFVITTDRKQKNRQTLTEWERAKHDAEEIVSRINTVRETWPFGNPDLRELIRLVNLEGTRAKPSPTPRDDTPSDRDMELVRQAVAKMGVRKPSRDGVGTFLRENCGVNMGNAKIGKALKRLRSAK